MDYDEEYRSKAIHVETSVIGKRFRWSYTIDGEFLTEGQDRSARQEHRVLDHALDEARRHVDRIVKATP